MLKDGANCIINAAVRALREAFDPNSEHPPDGGGSTRIRFFAGDAAPLTAFDTFAQSEDDGGCGCEGPFLWVRLMRRYRTDTFPQPYVGDAPCDKPRVIAVEIGVARCAVVFDPDAPQDCDMSAYESEADISLDDSHRIELALCRAARIMKAENCSDMVATDVIAPFGPEGGAVAWIGTLYARVDT